MGEVNGVAPATAQDAQAVPGSAEPAKTDELSLLSRLLSEGSEVEGLDLERARAWIRGACGSNSEPWLIFLGNQVACTLSPAKDNSQTRQAQLRAVVDALAGMKSNDVLEGMITGQLLAIHNATMECLRLAMLPNQSFAGWSEALSQANKLTRSSANLVEALNKHRGKGHQKVTVEHVHVNDGGNAIVGSID